MQKFFLKEQNESIIILGSYDEQVVLSGRSKYLIFFVTMQLSIYLIHAGERGKAYPTKWQVSI